jgi:WhiB family redox-sensing transcriptional regulator
MTNITIKQAARIELPEAVDLAAMVRESGADQVAADFGCSSSTIRDRLTQAGYTGGGLEKAANAAGDTLPAFQWAIQPWADRALCAETDPEVFFPEKGGSTREAKAVCSSCTVAAECLDWALERGERFGIWGGFSERERRHLQQVAS